MPTTVAEILTKDRIEMDVLEHRYQPVLELVRVLIGVVPNCDRYLEIWPPGFRTYNLMVPNFLNLPASLVGVGAPKDVVGLGMYTSSRAAACNYCSAHTCSFALRRGSTVEAVTGDSYTGGEAATVAVAEALSTVPHHYTPDLGQELERHFSARDAEWVVMGVAMMGFLNKFMDAVGVELEPEAVADVAELIEPTGWSIGQHGWAGLDSNGSGTPGDGAGHELPPTDSVGSLLRVARRAPGALRLERQWMDGVPKDPARARAVLAEIYGFDSPIITAMGHTRPRRALTAMLRHNLDPDQSELGIGVKALAGLVFATHAGNEHLAELNRALAGRHSAEEGAVEAAQADDLAARDDLDALDPVAAATVALARSFAPSPAAVDATTVARAEAELSSAQIVEVAVWVSVCQLLHRLSLYYGLVS